MTTTEKPEKPALAAIKGASKALLHWSTVLSIVAVVIVAHALTAHEATNHADAVFGASFTVFALLLPAVALLRDYVDRRVARLQVILQARNASNAAPPGPAEIADLRDQKAIFQRLSKTVAPLERGIVLAMVSTIASAAAIVAPAPSVWDHAPRCLVVSLPDVLAALAIVCLVSAVASMFPFTWHLLVRSNQIASIPAGIDSLLNPPPLPPT